MSLLKKLFEANLASSFSRNPDKVVTNGQLKFILSEGFSETPLDEVADRSDTNLTADGQPYAAIGLPRLAGVNHKVARDLSSTETLRSKELAAPRQPLFLSEALVVQKRVKLRHGPPVCYFLGTDTLRRARPLRRREASTARPPLVLIRERKPWVRLRLILLG